MQVSTYILIIEKRYLNLILLKELAILFAFHFVITGFYLTNFFASCSSKRFAKVILNIQIECIHNPHAGNSICFFTNITVIFHHLYLVCTLKLHWQRPYFY